MPKRTSAHPAILHPIQIVTRRTGVSADVLRVWEKRYAVVTPVRSTSGRRLYSDADIERLRLLVQATRTGRPIGQVAALPTTALLALLDEEAPTAPSSAAARAAPTLRRRRGPRRPISSRRASARSRDFDAVALDLLLRRAIVALSADDFLDAVVVPLVDHLRVRVLRRLVAPAARASRPRRAAPRARSRRRHRHCAPALARSRRRPAGAHAHELDAPHRRRRRRRRRVAGHVRRRGRAGGGRRGDGASTSAPTSSPSAWPRHPGDRVIPRELRRLRALLPARVEFLVVATTADVQRAALAETGATPIVGLRMLRTRLRALGDRRVGGRTARPIAHRAARESGRGDDRRAADGRRRRADHRR